MHVTSCAPLQSVGYGGTSYGGSSGGGGNVGVTQATTYAAEGGKQISTNDIHLDNSASNFVIGPDGKVPSLASQVCIRLRSALMHAYPDDLFKETS